ncbi:hypothetical protein QTP88_023036 [Uroleucon formosanum]
MPDEKIEQRINLKFLVKLGKSATESFNLLTEVYGDSVLSRPRVFEWHKRFREGREEVEDNQRVVRPCSSKTNDNISKINEIVRKDRRLSIRMIAEMVNIDKETVRQILHDELNMTKICAKMVPKNLTLEHKDGRRQICVDILEQMENERDLLKKVITCDETWIFQYDPETKRQSMHWKTSASPKLKKARMSKSKLKAMLIVFFDIKGVIMTKWVPQGQTVNQHYYLQVLTTLRERVRRKRPELWENDSWFLHQDNAPAHSALSVKRFLAKNRTPVLQHPPYSPDLAPCDFWLFPKLKSALKGTHFGSVEVVKTKATEVLKALQEKDFQHCFNQWKIRMERCVKHGGEYIEGKKYFNTVLVSGSSVVFVLSNMPSYLNAELADMHFIYGLCDGNTLASRREYENRFPGRRVPAPAMFARIHQALRDRGTFRRSLREGVHNADLEREILDEVNRDPETSTRALARQFGVHHTTRTQTINNVYSSIDGYFIIKLRIENPHLVRQQRFQRRFSINVWMGVIGGVLIGPFLGLPRTVGGNAYLNFLQNELPVLLEDIPLDVRRRMIYQHDGAPPHFSRAVRQHLNETFTSWIGRGGTIPWPPRSPDLTPLDFFVWGYLKERVYQQEVDSEAELRQRILQAAIEMRRVITAGVTGSQSIQNEMMTRRRPVLISRRSYSSHKHRSRDRSNGRDVFAPDVNVRVCVMRSALGKCAFIHPACSAIPWNLCPLKNEYLLDIPAEYKGCLKKNAGFEKAAIFFLLAALVLIVLLSLSKEQRVLIVKTHYQNGEHYAVTVRKLRTILGYHNAPNESTVRRLIKKFEESGSTQDKKISGRPRSGRSEANVTVVHDSVTVSPRKSCRRRAQEMHISPATMQRILTKDLHLHAYKVQLTQELKPADHEKRRQFVEWILTRERGFRKAHYFHR